MRWHSKSMAQKRYQMGKNLLWPLPTDGQVASEVLVCVSYGSTQRPLRARSGHAALRRRLAHLARLIEIDGSLQAHGLIDKARSDASEADLQEHSSCPTRPWLFF